MPVVDVADLRSLAEQPGLGASPLPATGGGWLAVVLGGRDDGLPSDVLHRIPAPVIGIGVDPGDARAAGFDVVVEDEAGLGVVTDALDAHPAAGTALVLLLRGGAVRSTLEGLVAESATYSMLQAGADHRGWLADRARLPRRARGADAGAVRVERDGSVLTLTLQRPEVRNAYDAATRDGLLEALAMVEADPGIEEVHLRGDGPAFCAGGDLDEFGTATDPAAAHLLRVTRSVAAVVDRLADRMTVHLHGACIGAGIELPAFAGRLVARPGAFFALPEVGMGLVPGAGGTVSIPRRIGRHRAAWLALTGARIDAATALAWGLVDEVLDSGPDE